ncbi:hypothetical protein OKW21_004283 [Catalinimonas alkaloidigena]|uniref:hypothetical protein n=1 Tax=Catalinimonas alkaloidigena TaxID=1075417 RepID=UPI002406D00A|nr:hypothetical protein [Catalinimonas alkaloidigena]MDF9799020.1 hypothetical protein [Catalinimonas alkaloidigena]
MNLKSESSVLEAAQLALSATVREENVRLHMEPFGLTAALQQQGNELLEKAKSCQSRQTILYDEQWSISQQLNAELDATHSLFKEHAKVSRMAFRKEPDLLHSLKIERFVKQAWPLVRQAEYFYERVLEQELNLQPYGISKKEIEQAKAAVRRLLELKETRMHKKGLAENCTQEKNAAFKELRDWVSRFRAIARLAFKGNPQMLEIFGIQVLSKV